MKTERRQISKEMREAEKQKQFDLKQKKRRKSTKVIKRNENMVRGMKWCLNCICTYMRINVF